MGTIVIGKIIDRARVTLLELDSSMTPDPTNTRWNRTGDLLEHANAAQREIVAVKPDACARSKAYELLAGAKQGLPDDGVAFLGVEHNLGADGATPGDAISIASRDFLGRADRKWMTRAGEAVQRFIFDQRVPKVWYCYPRPAGTWHVNLIYSAVPAAVTAANIDDANNGKIDVDDLYDTAIHDYIVGYALLKNSKAGEPNKADYFLAKFYNCLGRRYQGQAANAPLDPEAAEAAPDAPGKP